MRPSFLLLMVVLGAGSVRAQIAAAPAAPVAANFLPDTLSRRLDDFYDQGLAWKARADLPLSLGAWHWWTAGPDGKLRYGTPAARGTFFFFLTADPMRTVPSSSMKSFGAHVELRVNDGDKFRGFFNSRLWTYDSYVWAYTDAGTFKAGQIGKRFGVDWDDSFWGGTAYFDGFKLNPDWGVSWEKHRPLDAKLTLDTFAQFFVHEDGVNGALVFSDPESIPGFSGRNTGVVRLALKHQTSAQLRFEAALSGQAGTITSKRFDIASQRLRSVALDAAVHYAFRRDLELKIFGEWLSSQGALSPYRYVSGGASERIVDTIAGVQLRHGPVQYRSELSTGRDYRPGGKQKLTINGVTLAIAKNANLFIERVRWTVRPDYLRSDLIFEDGWEVVLNWRL